MKHIVGMEYLVIFRREYGEVPRVSSTHMHLPDAQAALRALQATAQAENRPIITKIETRTLFNTDLPPAHKELPARASKPVAEPAS